MANKIIAISPKPETVENLQNQGINRTWFFNQAYSAMQRGEWTYQHNKTE